jgi:hypothetical protein
MPVLARKSKPHASQHPRRRRACARWASTIAAVMTEKPASMATDPDAPQRTFAWSQGFLGPITAGVRRPVTAPITAHTVPMPLHTAASHTRL